MGGDLRADSLQRGIQEKALPQDGGTGSVVAVDEPGRLLAAYDEQLRGESEMTPGAESVTRHGPLFLVTFAGGRGWISYRDLGGADADGIRRLVAAALEHYRGDPAIAKVEWKSRGHDVAPGLHEALVEHGFVPEEPESIMIGEARSLAVDVPLPDGVTLRQVTEEPDVRAMSAMADVVFGDPVNRRRRRRCCAGWRATPAWRSGSPRPRGGSSAPAG